MPRCMYIHIQGQLSGVRFYLLFKPRDCMAMECAAWLKDHGLACAAGLWRAYILILMHHGTARGSGQLRSAVLMLFQARDESNVPLSMHIHMDVHDRPGGDDFSFVSSIWHNKDEGA